MDTVKATKSFLRKYRFYRGEIDKMEKTARQLMETDFNLDDPENEEWKIHMAADLFRDASRLQCTLDKLGGALKTLTDEERHIIEAHFMDGLHWAELARMVHMSESTLQKKAARIVKKIALAAFGNVGKA